MRGRATPSLVLETAAKDGWLCRVLNKIDIFLQYISKFWKIRDITSCEVDLFQQKQLPKTPWIFLKPITEKVMTYCTQVQWSINHAWVVKNIFSVIVVRWYLLYHSFHGMKWNEILTIFGFDEKRNLFICDGMCTYVSLSMCMLCVCLQYIQCIQVFLYYTISRRETFPITVL